MAEEVKRGFLTKRGRVVKNWKRRFFVLKGGSLSYYEDEQAVVAKGQLNLYGAAVVYVEPPKIERANCVEVSTPERSLFVCADNKQDLQDWALAIQRAAVFASGGTLVLSTLRLTDENSRADAEQAHAAAAAASAAAVAAPAPSAASSSEPAPEPAPAPAPAAPEEPERKEEERPAPVVAAAAAAAAPVAAAGAAAAAASAAPAAEEQAEQGEEDEDEDEDSEDNSEESSKDARRKRKEERRRQKEAKKAAEAAELEAQRRVAFTPEEEKQNLARLDEIFSGSAAAYEERRKAAKQRHKETSAKSWEVASIKCRKALAGHKKGVNCLFKADRVVVSGADDRRVAAWGVESLKQKGSFKMSKGSSVRAVVATPRLVAASSSGGEVRVWDRSSEERVKTLLTSTGEPANGLAVSEDGRALVAVHDTTVQVWDLVTFACLASVTGRHTGKITCVALAGRHLFTGSEDHTVRVWDMGSLEVRQTLEGHKNWVFCLAVAPGADRLYSGSQGILQWDISKAHKGKVKMASRVDKPHHAPSVQTLAVTEDEHFVVSASLDGRILLWAAGGSLKSKPAAELESGTKYIFSVATYGRRVFSADRDGSIRVWE